MCDPATGALLVGSAAVPTSAATFGSGILGAGLATGGATALTAGSAATAGLIGSGGALSLGSVFSLASNLSGLFFSPSQANNADQQAAIFAYNASVAANNATIAQQAADRDVALIAERRRALTANQSTAFAASGVVINTGTPLQIAEKTTEEFALDRLDRLHAGQIEADAARASQSNFLNASERSRINANNSRNADKLRVATNVAKFGASLI